MSDHSQDDLKGLIDGIEEVDVIEDTSEVGNTVFVWIKDILQIVGPLTLW